MFLDQGRSLSIALIDMPSEKCNRRISAQSSNEITLPDSGRVGGQLPPVAWGVSFQPPSTIVLAVIEQLPDGSYISEIFDQRDIHHTRPGVRVRVVEYTLAGHDDVYRLITTILDPTRAPAEELARLYAQRWEFESTLDEIKTHLGGHQLVLRSQYPDGAEQELYGFLLVHYAIRTLIHRAAREGDHDPDRLSFTRSLRVARRQVTDQAAFSPQQTRPRRQNHSR